MDDIGPDNYEVYMNKKLPMLYLFVSTDEERKSAGPEVEPLAKKYQGKISFVYLDACKCCYFFLISSATEGLFLILEYIKLKTNARHPSPIPSQIWSPC
jgi:hypothetical protein